MALNLEGIYQSMVRQFRTSTSDDAFQADFVAAINNVLDQMNFIADASTNLGHISSHNGSVSGLETEHSFIVTRGVVTELILAGRKHRDDTAWSIAMQAWDVALGQYQTMLMRDKQDAVDDDGVPTEDIVGLGYQG